MAALVLSRGHAELQVKPMISVLSGVAQKDAFGEITVGRSDKVLVAVEVKISPDAVVGAFVRGGEADERGDVGEIPVAVVAVELASLVRAVHVQIVVHEQIEVAVVVVIDGLTAIEIAADVGEETVAEDGRYVGELVAAVVAEDAGLLLIGADHEEVELAVAIVEVDELGGDNYWAYSACRWRRQCRN